MGFKGKSGGSGGAAPIAQKTAQAEKTAGTNKIVGISQGKQKSSKTNPVITMMGRALGEQLGTLPKEEKKNTQQLTGKSKEQSGSTGLKLGQWGAEQSAPLTNRALTGNNSAEDTQNSIPNIRNFGAEDSEKRGPNITLSGDVTKDQSSVPNVHAFGGSDWDWTKKETQGTKGQRTKATVGLPSDTRSTSWTSAGENLKTLQDLGNQIKKAEFDGTVDANMVSEYSRQSERYFTRPQKYTAENVGDYIDRVYYLAMTPGPDEDEKAEIREIMDVIAPSGSL